MAISIVDAEYISDGEIVIGSFDYPDFISRPQVTLGDNSQVRSGSECLRETSRKHLIVHSNSEPPARDSRFGNL
jgi:hypothetical protein